MYEHILIPVAFDEDRPPDTAFEIARRLTAPGGRVTLLHVMEEPPVYAISYIDKEYLANLREGLQAELTRLAAGFEQGTGLLIDGHPANTILEWAEGHGVGCIVMRSHKPELADYLLGSTAAHVARHAPMSVHLIR
jgi:nucleotide-binding universal stress UspA family protein